MNFILVSVEKLCNTKRIVVFTAKEAVALNTGAFIISKKNIVSIAKRNTVNGLTEFPASTLKTSCALKSTKVKKNSQNENQLLCGTGV